MIKSLKIRNFQSHEKTEHEFSDGVNVIIGSSDSGKTAIIRAIRWLVWNRPSGDAIRSSWGGLTSVELSTEETTIVRSKDKVDGYQLYGRGQALDFKAFGTSVPQEIVQSLNLSEINLQGQLDAPFLLSDTSGEVAAHFNKVAKLEKIDTATQNINAWIRGLTTDIKYKEAEGKALESQLTAYEDLDKFEIEVEDLEKAESEMNMLAADVVRLRNSIKSLQNCSAHLTEASRILPLDNSVNTLVNDVQTMRTIESHATKLYLALEKVKTTAADIKVETKMLTLDEPTEELLLLIEARKTLQTDSRNISSLLDRLFEIGKGSLRWQGNALKLEERFHKEMPDVCPLCNQPIKKK